MQFYTYFKCVRQIGDKGETQKRRSNAMPSPVQFIRSIMRKPSGLPSGTKIQIVYGSATIFAPPQSAEFCRKSAERKIPYAGLSGERVSKEISKRGLCAPQRAPALPFIRRTARR